MYTIEMELHGLLKKLTAVQTFVLLVFVVGNLRFGIIDALRPGNDFFSSGPAQKRRTFHVCEPNSFSIVHEKIDV